MLNGKKSWCVTTAILAFSLVSSVWAITPAIAQAYSCQPTHCYGYVVYGLKNTYGLISDMQVTQASDNGDSLISNEIWYADSSSSECADFQHLGGCWVEVGEIADPTDGLQYFWGDWRPSDTSWSKFLFQPVPSADIGQTAHLSIVREGSTSFLVKLISPTYDDVGESTGNTMVPTDGEIGEELGGTTGAQSPRTTWTNNQWVDTQSQAHYFATDGNPQDPAPPYANWYITPSASSNGGTWQANCC